MEHAGSACGDWLICGGGTVGGGLLDLSGMGSGCLVATVEGQLQLCVDDN